MDKNTRNKAYHSLKKVKSAIKAGEYEIDEDAQNDADDDFGWSLEDIEKAILKLKPNDCTSSKRHFTKPDLWVDHYRAHNVFGENFYTHFHFDGDFLIIGSFKRR